MDIAGALALTALIISALGLVVLLSGGIALDIGEPKAAEVIMVAGFCILAIAAQTLTSAGIMSVWVGVL